MERPEGRKRIQTVVAGAISGGGGCSDFRWWRLERFQALPQE
jgi:hypothetical protein